MDTAAMSNEFRSGLAAHARGEPDTNTRSLAWQQGHTYAAGLAAHAAGAPLVNSCGCDVCTICTSWRAGWLAAEYDRMTAQEAAHGAHGEPAPLHH